jgi:hypothetical protein
MGYTELNAGATDVPVKFHYLSGACVTSTGELANNVFNVSDIYPNPTTGTSTIEVNMKQSSNVSIEVTNMIGQVISSSSINLTQGNHAFTVDASKWNNGVYFYTVKAKDFTVTRKLVRE